ncbi:MAG: ribonuclease P protein component [Candidatus Pacebacteria bacterium]|nr:ribonuclease P protein component [Candidatus Paceibacterota bacterium]
MKEETKEFFTSVMRGGSLHHSPHLSLKFLLGGEAPVRVVVSKKVVSSAVSRNRLKRRIRAIFKEIHPPIQAIVFAKKGVGEVSFDDLRAELQELTKKALK